MQKKLFQTLLIATLMTPGVVMAKGACEIQGATTETKCHCGKKKPASGETDTCIPCGTNKLICSCVKQGSKYWNKICGASTTGTSSKPESN